MRNPIQKQVRNNETLIDKKFKQITEATLALRNEMKEYGVNDHQDNNPFVFWYSPRKCKFSAHVMGVKFEHHNITSCLRLCEKEVVRKHVEFTRMKALTTVELFETVPVEKWTKKKIIATFRKVAKRNITSQAK